MAVVPVAVVRPVVPLRAELAPRRHLCPVGRTACFQPELHSLAWADGTRLADSVAGAIAPPANMPTATAARTAKRRFMPKTPLSLQPLNVRVPPLVHADRH